MSDRRRRGFTLTELMIAIIVLAIAVIGTTAAIVSTSAAQRVTSRRGEMASVADSKIEEIRSGVLGGNGTLISTLKPPPVGSLTSSLANYSAVVTQPNGNQYALRWLVEAGPALTEKLTMRVIWPASGTAQLQVDVITYLLVP
jgi:prepilin-type N-terminal cleavage/methylation domain-containing protein